jgi:hypothetical protein
MTVLKAPVKKPFAPTAGAGAIAARARVEPAPRQACQKPVGMRQAPADGAEIAHLHVTDIGDDVDGWGIGLHHHRLEDPR